MDNNAVVSGQTVILALRDLCVSRQTGIMMIVTEDNRSMQITLRDGNIVACLAGLKEGREAIDLIKTVKAGRHFFNKVSPDSAASAPSLQISTDELLKELTGKGISDESGQMLPPAKLNALKKAVEEELKGVIGPIAGMVCEDHFEDVTGAAVSDLVKMLDQITMEVEERKRGQFKERLTDRLNLLDMQQIVSGYAKIFH